MNHMVNSDREWDWLETDWDDSVDVRPIDKTNQQSTLIED